MLSPLASTLGSLVGWATLPDFLTRLLLSTTASFTGLQSQPGTPAYALHYRRAFAFVVLSYLIYTIHTFISSSPPNFYEILGVPYDADEPILKSAFRMFARRFHPDRVGSQGEGRFVEVRDAYETLRHPIKRFAYDRFGADVLDWQQCTTFRDYVKQGLMTSIGFYIATTGFSVVMAFSGRGGSGAFWRYTLLAACFVGELSLIFVPSSRDTSPFLLHRLFPSGLPYQHVRLLHQLFLTISAALARVGPVLFPDPFPSDATTLVQALTPLIERIFTLSQIADREVSRMLLSEIRMMHGQSYNDNDGSLQLYDERVMIALTAEMEKMIIDAEFKSHPTIRAIWNSIIQRSVKRTASLDPFPMNGNAGTANGWRQAPPPPHPASQVSFPSTVEMEELLDDYPSELPNGSAYGGWAKRVPSVSTIDRPTQRPLIRPTFSRGRSVSC